MHLEKILRETQSPLNVRIVHKIEGTNSDIIQALITNYPLAVIQARDFAAKFKRGSRIETAGAIWKFVRNNAIYKRDGSEKQMIRLPRRFLYDSAKKFNSGDCKSFSLFIAGTLGALGLPVNFRFTSYKPGNKTPSHVYITTLDENGHEIIIDGVYSKFNREKPYFYKIDKPMTVETLAGMPAKKEDNPLLKAIADQYQTETIAGKKGKKIGQKIGRGILKIALGAGRGAFLAVLALNLAGLATKMKTLQNSGRFGRVKNLWLKLGGGMKLLNKAIQKGYKKKPVVLNKKMKARLMKEWKQQGVKKAPGISLDPGSISAISSAALPVLAAIIPAIAKAFKQPAKDGTDTNRADQQSVKELSNLGSDILTINPAPGEATENVSDDLSGIYATSNAGSATGGAKFENLSKGLTEWGGKAINFFGGLIAKRAKKKGKKGQQQLQKLSQAGDDYFAGEYQRKTTQKSAAGIGQILPIAAAAGIGIYLLTSKKR